MAGAPLPQPTKLAKLLQPRCFDAFHCIGSACEDTCCVGWIVHIDKPTYDKYQHCSDPTFRSRLQTLITINENGSGDDDYAKIVLNEAACPFLAEGLCSIHQHLGEDALSNMCAIYPRVMNSVDDGVRRSLDLSCPEAARLVLLNPAPLEFCETEYEAGSIRLGKVPALDTSALRSFPEPQRFFEDVQRAVLSILQNRSYPIWQRLLILGTLCDKLGEMAKQGEEKSIPVFNDDLDASDPHPATQLGNVLELIVARISSNSNPRRFLDCYREFMGGIQWTSKSTMDEIGTRYAEAYAEHYAPFAEKHQYLLEHYLVNYAWRTLFPFGLPESNLRIQDDRIASPFTAQYMLMVGYYSITQTLLIGMAGYHKSAFGVDHVLRLIQSCTKTFEHSLTYPGRMIKMLVEKGMTTPATLSVLSRN